MFHSVTLLLFKKIYVKIEIQNQFKSKYKFLPVTLQKYRFKIFKIKPPFVAFHFTTKPQKLW
jgi:hypothetical protein